MLALRPMGLFAKRLLGTCALLACTGALASCHVLGDEGEWLGERIGAEAQAMRRAGDTLRVIAYEPVAGVHHRYSVALGRSTWVPMPPTPFSNGALTVIVAGGRSGSTTYHERYVAVPRSLHAEREGVATQLVLRRQGDTIQVVQLR